MVDGRIVAGLLKELHRAGVPAYCAWFRPGRPSSSQRWFLWVGGSSYERAEERLAEVLPLLMGSLRHGPAAA